MEKWQNMNTSAGNDGLMNAVMMRGHDVTPYTPTQYFDAMESFSPRDKVTKVGNFGVQNDMHGDRLKPSLRPQE